MKARDGAWIVGDGSQSSYSIGQVSTENFGLLGVSPAKMLTHTGRQSHKSWHAKVLK